MIEDLFIELRSKLSQNSAKELDRIVKYPEVQALISQAEADTFTEREKLFKDLTEVAKKYAKPLLQAIKNKEASSLRLRELEQQLAKAKAAYDEDTRTLDGVIYSESRENRLISERILATADIRLHRMICACDILIESVRCAEPIVRIKTEFTLEHWKNGLQRTRTNSAQRDDAINEAATIRREIVDSQMQSMTHQDVTNKISEWILRLKNKMSILDLDSIVPELDVSGAIKIITWQEARSIREKSSPALVNEVKVDRAKIV